MGRVWDDHPAALPPRPLRQVIRFDTYDAAMRDARLRGACIVLDAHFRFWSTPTELTLHEIHSQMFRTLCDELDRPPHPDAVVIRTPAAFGTPAA